MLAAAIRRSASEPIRQGLTWDERWQGEDRGIIFCWEVGRAMRDRGADEAVRAEKGELVPLAWKGGFEDEKSVPSQPKIGSFYYLATWQGLRGDDLFVDVGRTTVLTCARCGGMTTFEPASLRG